MHRIRWSSSRIDAICSQLRSMETCLADARRMLQSEAGELPTGLNVPADIENAMQSQLTNMRMIEERLAGLSKAAQRADDLMSAAERKLSTASHDAIEKTVSATGIVQSSPPAAPAAAIWVSAADYEHFMGTPQIPPFPVEVERMADNLPMGDALIW